MLGRLNTFYFLLFLFSSFSVKRKQREMFNLYRHTHVSPTSVSPLSSSEYLLSVALTNFRSDATNEQSTSDMTIHQVSVYSVCVYGFCECAYVYVGMCILYFYMCVSVVVSFNRIASIGYFMFVFFFCKRIT